MLRADFLGDVTDALRSASALHDSDFRVSSSKIKGGSTRLEIVYQYDEDYAFRATIPTAPDRKLKEAYDDELKYDIRTLESPGEISATESHRYHDRSSLLSAVQSWVARIDGDLRARPILREQERLERDVAELMEKIGDLPGTDDYFSRAEATELESRLDALESKFTEIVTERTEDEALVAAELADLKRTVSHLKASLDSLTKANWAKKALRRLFRWLSKPQNRELLGEGVEAVRNLLPPGE